MKEKYEIMAAAKDYAWNPNDYAENSANQTRWARELIPKLELKGNERLLDIGCGDGKITAELAKNLPRGEAVGIDSSQDMINLAKATFPQNTHPNLSFQKMDACKMEFEEHFDWAFSNAALHWIIDQHPVLRGVHKCLKNGGNLLFQMGGKGNAKDIVDIVEELRREPKWARFFEGFIFPYGFYEPKQYTKWLREAHLEPLSVKLLPKELKVSGAAGLSGWVRTTWMPYTQRLPAENREEFVKAIVNRYLAKDEAGKEGMVVLQMVRLEVQALKPL